MSDRTQQWRLVRPWVGAVCRLVIGGVFIYAGWTKIGDLAEFSRSVNAYKVMPWEMARVVGSVLPMVEIVLGLILLAGLATRIAAAIGSGLLVIFITGIIQAWARGLSLDCGCFGKGGEIAPEQTRYGWEIARDLTFLAIALFIVIFPRTKYSLDARLAGPEEIE
jgi:uncharacterized membrane protein YphA (DoxX/SURF4 family)